MIIRVFGLFSFKKEDVIKVAFHDKDFYGLKMFFEIFYVV